jgi:hypothetical protein
LGALVALFAALTATYEFVAIETPAPTISRVLQGVRDSGWPGAVLIYGVATAIVVALVGFARWVWPHLTQEKRSNL